MQETQQASLATIREIRSDDQTRQLKEILSPADPTTNYHKGLKQRHADTCRWFLESERFKQWKQSEGPPALWLYGQPGAGKSVACSAIIENVLLTMRSSTCFVAYFYFDFSDTGKQTLEAALKSILYQLAQKFDKASQTLIDHKAAMPCSEMRRIFEISLAEMKNVVVILDALDEAQPCKDVLEWLSESINCVNSGGVRWVFTSRDYPDIRRSLSQYTSKISAVSLQADLIDRDIYSYVDARIHTDKSFQRWTDRTDDQSLIITSLVEKSCGMFRWAACQLDDLASCLTSKELRDTLARLPTTLPETYSRMLQKIPPARKDGAIRLLQFLMLSPRPLWLGEAANALAMNIEGETLYDRDKELPDHSELALYCPGLISTVHVEGEEHKKLQLSHLSVKEYLLSALVHEEFRADLSTAKASSMVTVLLLRSFTQWFQSLRENLSEQEKHRRRHWPADNFPLALYAVHNWTEFARKAEVQAETQEYIVGFLIDQSRLECLLQCYNALNYDSYYVGPMYIAVEGRLLHTATALLRKGISSRMKHSYRGKTRHDMKRSYRGWKRYDETMSPLAVACQNGHHEMVKRLLKKQSRSSVDDFWGAATAAASEGHCHILELLFEKVPHWQSLEKPVTRSPVHAAIDGRHVDVLSMLLGHGFDANPRLRLKSKITRPAIQEAISIGDIAAIKLLVAHGADLKMGGCRNTVVHTAAQTSLSVMQHVSSYGLFLDAEDYDGTTPLHLACKGRNLAIAEFLIQHGADVTKRDGFGRTILHLAAEKGLLPLLEYTISIDMAVDLENHRGETPLHRAYSSGDLATVKFLVDHGADVTKRDNAGNTMLHSAANTGFLPLLEYTSSFGLPIDVGNEVGQRPLHCTSFYMYDNIEAVRFLVEAGADINKKNYRGHSPLAEAIDRQKRSRWANCRAGISYLRERGAIEPDLDRNGYSIPAPHPHAREIESLLNGWWKLHQRHPSTKHKRYKHRHGIPEYHSEDEDDIKRARKNFQPLYFQNPERPYEIHRYNPRRLKHFASSHF